jgi:thiol-disulfide isomerase/thioredoxin
MLTLLITTMSDIVITRTLRHKAIFKIISLCLCAFVVNIYPLLLHSNNQKTEINVVPINQEQLQQLLKNRNGKALFLNVWATWCIPCVEEFPDIIRISKEFKSVEVVALSADYPEDIEEKILPFAKKLNVPFKVYVADFSSQDEFFALFDSAWGGEIPATFLYDRNGRQMKFLRGKHTYDDFKKAIEETAKN